MLSGQQQQPPGSAVGGASASGDAAPLVAAAQQHQQPPQQQQQQQSLEFRHTNGFARPCMALSMNIMHLYRLINSRLSEERRRHHPGPRHNDGYDDRHGHYLVFTGEEIWGRYTVQGILGRGSFGTVLKCFDEKHQEQVAAKVIRNGEYFYEQGLIEVDIVARLNSIPALESLVVRLGKVFVWKNHLVLVFEMLSMNLYQLIQRTNYNGVSLDLTRKFAYQLVLVLKQLEEHHPPIIHCDVKPENVVLRDASRSSIRLIDFGSACYLHQGAKLYKYVQSRFYRSPEVILEIGYDTAIDRWSLGCMLVELHTGVPLFTGKNEIDQIARFTSILGPLPDDMIERSHKRDVFYRDLRQMPLGQDSRHGFSVSGESPTGAHVSHPPRHDQVASPSPVIAAEVLHSISITSSISAITSTSVAAGPIAPFSSATTVAGTTATTNTAAAAAAAAVSEEWQQQLFVSSQSQPSRMYRNASAVPVAGGAVIPAAPMRRPLSAVALATASKGVRAAPCGPAAKKRTAEPAARAAVGPMRQLPAKGLTTTTTTTAAAAAKSPFALRVAATDNCFPLEEIIGVRTGGPRGSRLGQPGHDEGNYRIFLDFIQRLLCYDPRRRMRCAEALQHPFLSELEAQKQSRYLNNGA